MPKTLTIAVPCWGREYRRLFLGPVMRSHRAALDRFSAEFRNSIAIRYVVQTDDPIAVARALGDFELTLVPSPSKTPNPMRAMAGAHKHAIDTAGEGEHIVLLNADMLVSVETFVAVERRFREGRRAVVASGTRTVEPWRGLPAPMAARDMHEWSIRNAHPITKSCYWGTGKCHLPWGIYFREGDNIVLRAFHLHPLAIVKDRKLPFEGTIDLDLLENYRHDEIHLVTSADELALAEVSPEKKRLGDNEWAIDTTQILAWALRGARPLHWWNFEHRIAIQGDPALVTEDIALAAEVLRLCPYDRDAIAA